MPSHFRCPFIARQNHSVILSFLIGMASASCKKEYVDKISEKVVVGIQDDSFFVDSVSIGRVSVGQKDITFDVHVYGNHVENADIEVRLGDTQTGYDTGNSRYIVEDLIPNHPYQVTVNIHDRNNWGVILATASIDFTTTNNVENVNTLYDHRKYYVPMDHIQTADGGFVFLSVGNSLSWRWADYIHPQFEYKYQVNLNMFKTDAEGKLLWRQDLWEIMTDNHADLNAVVKAFSGGDLLILLGSEVRRYSPQGDLKWKYSLITASQFNTVHDSEIMEDGTIYIAGSSYDMTSGEYGRILHLTGDGKLIADNTYETISGDICSFLSICSVSSGDLYIVGRPLDNYGICLLKVTNMEAVWTKKIVYDEDYISAWNTRATITRAPNDQLFFSTYFATGFINQALAAKLDLNGEVLAGRMMDYLEFKHADIAPDGKVYVTGANNYGMLSGYNRLLILDDQLEISEDVSFQGGYGTSEGYNIKALPNDRFSIFGLSGGIQWHSLF